MSDTASKFDYIKVAVHGLWDGETKTIYTFPSAEADAALWNELPDASAIIKNFLNARECYLISHSQAGHFYGLVTRNLLDSRSGYVLLAVNIADGYSLTGRQVVNTLNSLKKTLLEDGDRNDDAVARCLEAVGIPPRGVKLAAWRATDSNVNKGDGLCYRTYVSGQELEAILSFPDQADYTRYKRLIVIPATSSLRPGIKIDRITSPVKKVYTVLLPEGVTSSADIVADGERVTLTYRKEGFTDRRETVVAGSPSPYVRYEGSAMRVKSAAESGMGFKRVVKIAVKSAKGGAVNGYTINVNGRPVNTMDPAIELNERDMTPGSHTEVSVASNNYRPLKKSFDSAELAAMETLELVLEPMEQGIILRLDFGEGRVFEQEISIEKNTPEYSQLHSGNFHGFRAHRVTTPGAGEIYNVDVRSSSKPTPPSFTNVAGTPSTPSSRGKAPVFENVTASGNGGSKPDTEEKKKGNFFTGLFTGADGQQNGSGKKMGYILGTLLAILLLALAIIFVLPGGKSEGGSGADTTATTFGADQQAVQEEIARQQAEQQGQQGAQQQPQQSQQAAQGQQTPPPAATSSGADEKADIEYLNTAKVWDIAQLKTQKYKDLITAISEGNIKATLNNDYYAVEGNCTNKQARDMAKWMWESIGTPQEKLNVQVMKDKSAGGKIDVREMWDQISRRRPSQPNPDPLPKK